MWLTVVVLLRVEKSFNSRYIPNNFEKRIMSMLHFTNHMFVSGESTDKVDMITDLIVRQT